MIKADTGRNESPIRRKAVNCAISPNPANKLEPRMALRYLCKNKLKLCRYVYASIPTQKENRTTEIRAESRRVHTRRMRMTVNPRKLGLSLFWTRNKNPTLCHKTHQNIRACNEFSMPIEYILNGRLCNAHKLAMKSAKTGCFRTAPILKIIK